MDKYSVKLMSRALRDLDGIYAYIAETLLEPETALAASLAYSYKHFARFS